MHVLYGFFLLSVVIAMATFTTLVYTLNNVAQYVAASCVATNMIVVVGAHVLYWNVFFEEFKENILKEFKEKIRLRVPRVRRGQPVTPEVEEPLQALVQAPLTHASLLELANQRGESLNLSISEDLEPPLLMPPPDASPEGGSNSRGEVTLPRLERQLAFEDPTPTHSVRFHHGREWPLPWPMASTTILVTLEGREKGVP